MPNLTFAEAFSLAMKRSTMKRRHIFVMVYLVLIVASTVIAQATGLVLALCRIGFYTHMDQAGIGNITTSYSTRAVNGIHDDGCLAGNNYIAIITASYSTGTVTGNDLVGGFVGDKWYGLITTCFWDIQT